MKKILLCFWLLLPVFLIAQTAQKTDIAKLEPLDVFNLEFVSSPQISPDGKRIIYARNFKDIMTDRNLSNLWMVNVDGTQHQPLTTGNYGDRAPLWSADGQQIFYRSNRDGKNQIYRRWLDTGMETKLSNLQQSPGNMSLSPDGKWLSFTMNVAAEEASLIKMPAKPKGAKWAAAPKYIDKLKYRADGSGFLKSQYQQIFLLSVDGGTPRQLTDELMNHNSRLAWSADGQSILFSANRHADAETTPNNSEIYELTITDGRIKALTDRFGPDNNPMISPNGKLIAYTGLDDKYLGYQQQKLYVMNRDGSNVRLLSGKLDRSVNNVQWGDNATLYFQYDNEGDTKIASIDLQGNYQDLTNGVGGMTLGRPYSAGTFSVAKNGTYAYTHVTPQHPADLAIGGNGRNNEVLTHLNDDLFSYKQLGEVEEIWYKSSADGQRVQGWICKPPNFDPNKKYPLLLEIHGGPFANYGNRFSSEVQLYAAAGYVILYTNPRGSSSYGADFGNLIHHNYPSQDYDDLISGVDAVIAKGYVNPDRLYVTGGSGGGVLTAWIIGKTNRFKAAVVAKPVINWYSFVLHADNPAFFYKYWFPGKPWEHQEHYMKRSPISLVGNVKTPTMLLTGEQDYRTPMSETEQYYAALKINGVETAMVRIQESGHGIANRPSNLMAKVLYVLGWMERYP